MIGTNKRWILGGGLLAVLILGAGAVLVGPALMGPPAAPPDPTAELEHRVHALCASCHVYPPPDSFPKTAWKDEVEQGYAFALRAGGELRHLPPMADVLTYYETRAPHLLPRPTHRSSAGPPPATFEAVPDGAAPSGFGVSNVSIVHLLGRPRPEILACDMRQNEVRLLRPDVVPARWQVLAPAPHPARAEVVDLDGDGVRDVLIACLGAYMPTDDKCGSVLWLRGDQAGRFTPTPLLSGVGRVADVRPADFDADGDLDLVVAVFGWRETGAILLLENRTTDWAEPRFVPKVLDDRHGTIHLPVADLDQDGRPDFVALISQEHEAVVAFLNTGRGFRTETVWAAPHPAYGSSGIELVDLDGDGDQDVLYTNGDTLDNSVIRSDHGVQWLENRGGFPFIRHGITPMPGVNRAVAADFDADGDLDVLAVSFLPATVYPEQADMDSVILLEQVGSARFVRYSLERGACHHATCAVGDLDGSGRPGFVTGSFALSGDVAGSITQWKNRAARPAHRPDPLAADPGLRPLPEEGRLHASPRSCAVDPARRRTPPRGRGGRLPPVAPRRRPTGAGAGRPPGRPAS